MSPEKSVFQLDKNFTIGVIFLIFILLFVPTTLVYAQNDTPPTDNEVNAIAKDLYCPVCENTPLDVCPTVACAQWRDMIREKLTAGWSKEQISQYFVDQYGDRVLAEPPKRGFNWLVYVLPPIFFLGGCILVYKNLRKIKNHKPGVDSGNIDKNDPYMQEVEEALQLMNRKDQGN